MIIIVFISLSVLSQLITNAFQVPFFNVITLCSWKRHELGAVFVRERCKSISVFIVAILIVAVGKILP